MRILKPSGLEWLVGAKFLSKYTTDLCALITPLVPRSAAVH